MEYMTISMRKGSTYHNERDGVHYTFAEDVTFDSVEEMTEYVLARI